MLQFGIRPALSVGLLVSSFCQRRISLAMAIFLKDYGWLIRLLWEWPSPLLSILGGIVSAPPTYWLPMENTLFVLGLLRP